MLGLTDPATLSRTLAQAGVLGLFLLALGACATPPVTGTACDAAQAVLLPVIRAAQEDGGAVEIEGRTSLVPAVSDTARWRMIRDFGFVPSWRPAGTDAALRSAYWRAWRDLDHSLRIAAPDEADRIAWAAAYAQVGDDRVYPDEAQWAAFFDRNRRSAEFTCAAEIARVSGARLVDAQSPRAPGAMRVSPAAPGLHDGRALMAAWGVYPPFEAGGAPRETGTLWLLRSTRTGDWRVLSARRVEAME